MAVSHVFHHVIGTVKELTEEMLSLELEGGVIRDFSTRDAKKSEAAHLKPGNRVLLECNEADEVVDIVNIGQKHQLVLVRGEIVGQDKKRITLRLKNGTSQSYEMEGAMAGKMSEIKKGTSVTLIADQQNHSAIDAHVD